MSVIELATTDAEIAACHPVMSALRPGYSVDRFVSRIKRQQRDGYRLVRVVEGDAVVAVAGYRLGENLAWGSFMYVDDLVTHPEVRSRGHGARLLDWLTQQASESGCDELHLDSGVQRFAAHRFYLRHRLEIASHHFRIRLTRPS